VLAARVREPLWRKVKKIVFQSNAVASVASETMMLAICSGARIGR